MTRLFFLLFVTVTLGLAQKPDWKEIKNKPAVEVRDHGAKPTTGFNSTSAFNSAIAAVASKGTVYVYGGTYEVDGLTISGKVVHLRCDGARLKLRNNRNLPVVAISGQAAAGSTISGCEVDGNKANNPSPGAMGNAGIAVSDANDVRLFDNNLIDNLTAGIAVYSSDRVRITKNSTSGNGKSIWVTGTSSQNLIQGNYLNSDINGIQLYDSTETADDLAENVIQNNVVVGTTGNSESVMACIGALYAPRTVITNNTILNCGARGVMVFGSSLSQVTSNYIFNSGSTTTTLFGGAGIDTDDSDRLTITGNTITFSQGSGIVIVNTRFSTVTGNYIGLNGRWCNTHPVDSACSGIAVLWETGPVTGDNMIANNIIIDNAQYGIREDDYTPVPDPSKFANNSYIGNYLFNNGAEDLSIFCTSCVIGGNRAPSTIGGSQFWVEGLKNPAIKSTTGTRYVCVDNQGTLVSSTTPCSGT